MFEDSQLWIHLSGLPIHLTEGDLACILSGYGDFTEICMSQQDKDENSSGSCFIKYKAPEHCDRAVHYLHGTTLLGNKLDVTYADKLYTKRKRIPQKERDEETKHRSTSTSVDSKQSSEDDLITNMRDKQLVKADCLSDYVNLGLAQVKAPRQTETLKKETNIGREEYHSSSTRHRPPELSSSTRDSEPRHRESYSPARSSRSQNRSPLTYRREPSRRIRDSYSPLNGHYHNSSTVFRYREDSPALKRRRLSPISPIRRITSRSRNSSSPHGRRIQSPSSPSDRRSHKRRDSRSPRREDYSSCLSPHRGYEVYHHYEYVRSSPHRHRGYSNHDTDGSSSRRHRRSTFRHCSRSPQREQSRNRDQSSSQHRDRSISQHRDQTSRSPSSCKLDRVSSTSHSRSRSCQRNPSSRERRSYYAKKVDDRENSQERGRRTPIYERRNVGVGATGISLVLERRLSRHYESNGI